MSREPGIVTAANGCVGCLIVSAVGLVLVTALVQWIDWGVLLAALLVGVAFWALLHFQGGDAKSGDGPANDD
ncbi:hypothetical protein [Streptomyces sp. NPDC057438]|uniref:hypothetical protein n=1 Tax=Streptomyces sp. NPDC057438 TaxID=3346133 RepID=UPI0036A14E67